MMDIILILLSSGMILCCLVMIYYSIKIYISHRLINKLEEEMEELKIKHDALGRVSE